MLIRGLVESKEKGFFTIKIDNKKEYFYLTRNLHKKFNRYLQSGIYVCIEVEDEKCIQRDVSCYKVLHFNEISNRKLRRKITYYSVDIFRNEIKKIITNLNYTVFIDFEFNMHEKYYPNFTSEIIEAGYCVCDSNLNILKEKNLYLFPTKVKKLTKRTIKFLNYKKEQLDSREKYLVFYNEFKNLISKYDPYFVVWGKNDIEVLKQSFHINKVKKIDFKFLDLSQMHINYYNLKNMPGLFKTAESYNNIELPKQKHNALEDALITKLVFSNFKEIIEG